MALRRFLLRVSLVSTAWAVVAVAVPGAASAAVETFRRFEAIATANYTVTEQCADGSTAELLVTVIGGHEEEQENGATTLDSDFVTVLVRGFDCAGEDLSDRGTGPADFRFAPKLRTARVTGSLTTDDGREVTLDVRWTGVGELEVDRNVTTRPGFRGVFINKRRDAVATGNAVVDGYAVSGSTDNAEIETLEDRNTTRT